MDGRNKAAFSNFSAGRSENEALVAWTKCTCPYLLEDIVE